MTDDPAQYAGERRSRPVPAVRPDHGGRRRAARGGRGHRAARRARPRPGRRPHPSPAADQPGLDPGRDRPRRVGPVPAPVRGGQGHRHRRGGRRADRRSALAPDHADPAGHGRPRRPGSNSSTRSGSRGVHWVNPFLALTHVVTTREIAFDVPVARSAPPTASTSTSTSLLTLGIADPVKFAYTITTGDLDQFIHATTQDGRPHARPRHRGAVRARPRVRRGGAPARHDRRQARAVRRRRPERRVHPGHAPGRAHRVARGAAARRDPAVRGAGELRARSSAGSTTAPT